MTRTVTVILDVDDDTHQRIANTIDAYATMYMAHVKWANTHNSVSTVKAHRDIYGQLRRDYPHVPSAIIQCARNNAFGSVKSFNTQNPKKKWTKNMQYRARSAKYDRRTVSLNTLGVLTFSLAGGKRGKVQVDVPKFFRDRYGNWEFNSATIGVNKKRQVFANLSYRKLPPQKKPSGDIVGADRGIYNIATTSNGHNFSSKKIRGRKRQFKHNRETLKAKVDAGSRSAKRRYNALKGKESRFNRNELGRQHCLNSYSLISVKPMVLRWWRLTRKTPHENVAIVGLYTKTIDMGHIFTVYAVDILHMQIRMLLTTLGTIICVFFLPYPLTMMMV